jgi:peptidoglycan/xylan/chitin deacetylase (PgdA/CDA1 family)
MLRPLIGLLSPSGARARLSILIFHRVLSGPDPLYPEEVDRERFTTICRWLAGWFNVLPLDQAVRQMRVGELPARAAAITFDDGYADNHDVAWPVLRQFGLPATFFVTTGFTGGGLMWNDIIIESIRGARVSEISVECADAQLHERFALDSFPRKRAAIDRLIELCRYLPREQRNAAVAAVAQACRASLPKSLMMNAHQIRCLHQDGMQIGGHTVSHPILARLPAEEARQEITGCKQDLEQLLQAPVPLFAYPNGRPGQDFSAEHALAVEAAGYEAAVTTAWGVSNSETNRFQIPRFTPWDRSRLRFGIRLAGNIGLRRPPSHYLTA